MYFKIRKERLDRDWTQQFVANNVGVSKQTIHDIETGRRAPSYKVLCKLEKLFGKPHSYLLEQTAVEDEK